MHDTHIYIYYIITSYHACISYIDDHIYIHQVYMTMSVHSRDCPTASFEKGRILNPDQSCRWVVGDHRFLATQRIPVQGQPTNLIPYNIIYI